MSPPMTTLVQQSLFRSFQTQKVAAPAARAVPAAKQTFPNGTILFKVFNHPETGEPETYRGVVTGYEQVVVGEEGKGEYLYHVEYEDGDKEHLKESELKGLVRGDDDDDDDKKKKIPKTKTNSPPLVSNDAMSQDEDDDDGDDDDVQDVPPPSKSSSPSGGRSSISSSSNNNVAEDKENSQGERGGSSRRSRRAAACKRVSYYKESSDNDDDDDDDDDDDKVRTKKPAKKKAKTLQAKRKKKAQDSDESEASFDADDDVDDDSLGMLDQADDNADEDDDFFEEEEEHEEAKPTTKRSRNKPATKKQKKAETTKTAAPPKKKMSESFQPINAPTYPKLSLDEIQKTKDYLDPCGMEATDDIIDRLVGEQVDKISGLLDRALESGNKANKNDNNNNIGSLGNPLKLGTACSGTDAPSLALTLIQEQLELRGKKGLFHHSHLFSCENEPFKQAYLARNFDSILYPDITRLVNVHEEDYVPCDVYGQEQKIPPFNLFVAGTSCKNFSMLRSKFRIDIEDKGCSGETFLAATEVLFKEKPELAIFENVTNAPWAKMSEYITGRVKLSACSDAKAIKEIKDKNKELKFALDKKDGQIVVDVVPSVYGVRCGAVVAGFMQPGSTKLKTIKWPSSSSKTTQCTLSELIRANNIDKANDTLVFETECTYCTQTVKVDTKDFGLPQTRQRVYMFVWRPENDNINDDLGQFWVDIVNHLKSPVRHSLDSFMLQDDHEVIRLFREALNGPPGRQSKRACFLEQDFWGSVSANLPHNKNTRAALGMEDTARWLMNWGPNGKKQIPPSFWLEYFDCNYQREIDMMDILYGSGIRDAETHDPLFCSYYWNVSQNVTKEKHRASCPGIAGCITPGGDFVVPHRGRPLLGCEKLLIQGLPYFRLILGIETEVQLGDLAGNAMSLTVVCATMLAALTCKQLREETMSKSRSSESILRSANKQQVRMDYENGLDKLSVSTTGARSAMNLFQQLASLADEAVKSSIFCTCETSGRDTLSEEFLRCKLCGVSCCRNCISQVSGYNLSSHNTKEVKISSEDHDNATFQTKLRNIVPPSLIVSDGGWSNIGGLDGDCHRVEAISGCRFSLHRIKRDRKKWVIVYYARENHGIGEAVAELRLQVGELYSEGESRRVLGMQAELTSYMPSRTEPRVCGQIAPCAKLILRHHDTEFAEKWFGRNRPVKTTVRVEGTGITDSPRVEVGLKDSVATDIRNAVISKKEFKEAKARGEQRRWLYAKNWKQWPSKISLHVENGTSAPIDFSGEYIRASCRQTTNQSGLWIRNGVPNKPTLYILIQPNVNRTGPSKVVVSSSLNHYDLSSVIAEFPHFWQPCDAFAPKDEIFTINQWSSLPDMKCMIPKSTLVVSGSNDDDDTLVAVNGLSNEHMLMFCRGSLPEELTKLNVESGQQAQQVVRVFNSTCVAPILQLAASSGLKYDVTKNAKWIKVPRSSVAFGHCKRIIPSRPSEEWVFNGTRGSWERRSNPQEARKYYVQLQDAPKPFELWIDPVQMRLLVKCFPEVVAHHAAHNLLHGRGTDIENSNISVCFKLSDVLQQSDPVITPFIVGNCNKENATDVPLKEPFRLYERQQKVVTKMLAIERRGKSLEELEMFEYQMPGSTGMSLVAKATRTTNIRGGVIADAIGAGKTVISIAIILAGIKEARASRALPRKSGATLVVVPPALISQWESEIEKFTDDLSVVKIYDLPSYQKRFTLKDIINADVVIIPIDILESSGYLENLLKLSRLENSTKDIPKLPPYSGQLEQNAARGVWIPHTSTDPYGGGNNNLNQRRRDQSAFYTYRYSQAIEALRQQTFKDNQKGVPVEYFEWDRLIVDEVHETLCTTKGEMETAKESAKQSDSGFFKEKNRRAGRELLGITQRDTSCRPLVCRRAVFGLTGTPLLDSSSRVIELANLMGGCYVIGLSSHWRKLERESSRDIFLHNYLEPKQSREVRKAIHAKAQEFLDTACCRNKSGEEMAGIQLNSQTRVVQMNEIEKTAYLNSQSGIPTSKKSLAIRPDDFDVSAGHDISRFLRQNAKLECRGRELVRICNEILEKDPTTKIVVFTDGKIGGGIAARDFLQASGLGCTWLDQEDSVEHKNEKIGWYQHGDATEEDRKRPRVLVLHFEHAAGLNLQSECYNLILFTPLYVGVGGSSSDPVADCSTELQAIGRVFRAGQPRPQVNVYRIEVKGPDDEECLDGHLIRRNTDETTIEKAVNAGDD